MVALSHLVVVVVVVVRRRSLQELSFILKYIMKENICTYFTNSS